MSKKFVQVITTNNPGQAHLMKSLLEANDIECVIFDEYMATTFEYNIAVGYIKLNVPEEDFPEAENILIKHDYLKKYDPDDNLDVDPCPSCNSRKISVAKKGWLFFAANILLFLVPGILQKKTLTCRNCRHTWKSEITPVHLFFSLVIGIFYIIFWSALLTGITANK